MELDLTYRLLELPFRLGRRHFLAATVKPVAIIWPKVYEWPLAAGIVSTLKDALARCTSLREERTPQAYKGVIMLGAETWMDGDRVRKTVVLDYSDYHHYICEEALRTCDLYIKLQYRAAGYSDRRIIPGGYPVTDRDYYRYYNHWRRWGNRHRHWNIVGRFGLTFQREVREKAVEVLKSIPGFSGVRKVRYSHFLAEVANSKLALHMPGNGPFTHRVAEFLGLGTCMLSQRFATELHVPLLPGIHYVEIAPDLSDLREKAMWYLTHEADRNAIATAGREYFDNHLHADHLASYYVREILAPA